MRRRKARSVLAWQWQTNLGKEKHSLTLSLRRLLTTHTHSHTTLCRAYLDGVSVGESGIEAIVWREQSERDREWERECVYIAADQRGRLCCDARLRSIALFRESFWVPKSPVHSWYTPTVLSVCLSIYMFVRPIFPVSVCCQRWVASVVLTWLVQYPTAAAGAEAHILSLSILA